MIEKENQIDIQNVNGYSRKSTFKLKNDHKVICLRKTLDDLKRIQNELRIYQVRLNNFSDNLKKVKSSFCSFKNKLIVSIFHKDSF